MTSALILLAALLLAPLLLVDVPPLLDYPNHLARATVLAFGSTDPILSRIYATHWAIIPDLGIDLFLPPLMYLLPVHVAGRVVVGVVVVLPVLGTVAYSRALFGTNSPWALASVLVAYNGALVLGFLAFEVSIGFALLFAAGWIAWRDRHPRLCIMATGIGAVALFFCHLMGLVFFYALIGGGELEFLWRQRADIRKCTLRLAGLLPLIAVPLLLYAYSALAPLAVDIEWSSPADKGRQLLFPFANYIEWLDIGTACLVAACLIGAVVTRRCRIPVGARLSLILLGLLYVALPHDLKGTSHLDTRVPIMLAFLLCGAVRPARSRRAPLGTAILFALLFAIRMSVVAVVWRDHQHDVDELRTVTAAVEPGARVFVATVSPDEAPEYWKAAPRGRMMSSGIRLDVHLPALLLIEHRAYWPFLFDNESQQPIRTLPPYRALALQAGSIPDHRALDVPGLVDLCGYDYLLLLSSGGEPDLAHFATARLSLQTSSDMAALFRITAAACAS